MRLIRAEKFDRFHIETGIINLLISLFLFRSSIPWLKYPFIAFAAIFYPYILITYRKEAAAKLTLFLKTFYLQIFLFIILLYSLLISNKVYLVVVKDLSNAIIVFSFFYLLLLIVDSREKFKYFVSSLVELTILWGILISLYSIASIIDVIPYGNDLSEGYRFITINLGEAEVDNNFALIPIFFALLGVLYVLSRKASMSSLARICYNLALILFSTGILLSGSRRGVALFLFIYILSLFFVILRLFKRKTFNTVYSFLHLSVPLMLVLFYLFFFKTSFDFKEKFLNIVGSKNVYSAKAKITQSTFRYASALKGDIQYSEFYKLLWSTSFIPEDPDKGGWGLRIHKTVYPLKGKNSEILPAGAKGYLMDSTCNVSYYRKDNISESYSLIFDLRVKDVESYKSSVYCFVSDEFSGNRVTLTAGASTNNILSGNIICDYDLKNKGVWQKLEIQFSCKEGDVPIYISFVKTGVKDFSKLKGHVIFAYPTYQKIENSAITRSSVIFFPVLSAGNAENIKDNDAVRKWIAGLISEDTTYYGLRSGLLNKIASDQFIEGRLSRWKFAIDLFQKEYNVRQKIMGGGFNFLNWYGNIFLNDKKASDYPHNPFLHILLYSGILGLLLYIFFMYKTFSFYSKYFHITGLFFIYFVIVFFFCFFSSGCPFDPPVMGFFSMLPFFTNCIYQKLDCF